MTTLSVTIRKDDDGWHTYIHSDGDMLPMRAMEEVALGVARAKDYLNENDYDSDNT